MQLQYISDNTGNPTAVVIPMDKWNELINKYSELENDVLKEASVNRKRRPMSYYAGILTKEEGEAFQRYVQQSRNEW